MKQLQFWIHRIYIISGPRTTISTTLHRLYCGPTVTDQEIQDYQVRVYLFGGIHSSNAANYALKRTASDYENFNGSDTAETLRHTFYVICLNQQRKLLFSCCRSFL